MAEASDTTTKTLVIGANQRSSSLIVRERLFIEDHAVPGFLHGLQDAGLAQALVLSTCDRIEVHTIHPDHDAATDAVVNVMSAFADLAPTELRAQLYVHSGADALRHIFSVTASLDSLVIGEPQVLGQIKSSHRMAQAAGMIGQELDTLLRAAYGAAKRVRSQTAIGQRPVSMAAAAVDLSLALHGDLARCGGLLVGAGDMGERIVESMLSAGLHHLVVTHPNPSRAEATARTLDCHVISFDELTERLTDADIVVTSLGSRERAITKKMIRGALRKRRHQPMLLVDTGIPGDIDPAVQGLEDAFAYDLNDLERLAMEGRASRESEARTAWSIIDASINEFMRDSVEREAAPTLVALRRHFANARAAALADAKGDAERATRLLVNRLLHGPSKVLRQMAVDEAAAKGKLPTTEELLRQLFGLNGHAPKEDE